MRNVFPYPLSMEYVNEVYYYLKSNQGMTNEISRIIVMTALAKTEN